MIHISTSAETKASRVNASNFRVLKLFRKCVATFMLALAIRLSFLPKIAHAKTEILSEAETTMFENQFEIEEKPAPKTQPTKKREFKMFKLDPKVGLSYVIVSYGVFKLFYSSATDLSKQRKRVREENLKFNQNAEEYLIDEEVAYNEDIMRELRNLKESTVGPLDKYAKETRRYNPDFAATHEPLDGVAEDDDDDLLGREARMADEAKAEAEKEKKKAERAAKMKKLFDSSSSDDGIDEKVE